MYKMNNKGGVVYKKVIKNIVFKSKQVSHLY